MPLVEGRLAVIQRSGFYKDLDPGDKDILSRGDVVRLIYMRGESWIVDPGPGMNTMLVPSGALAGFKDPASAESRYRPGSVWGRHLSNPNGTPKSDVSHRRQLLREIEKRVREGKIPQKYLSGAMWMDTKMLESLLNRYKNPSTMRYQCGTCYKVYRYWGACAKHISKAHGGYGIVMEFVQNPFIESLVSGLGIGTGFAISRLAVNSMASRRRRRK